MSFISLIFKNPFRNKSRALLAIIGIGIGIATIVVLGAITAGLTTTMDDTLHAGGSDFSISGKGESASTTNPFGTVTFSEDWVSIINNVSGVKNAAGVYIGMVSLPDSPYFTLIGINSNDTGFADLKITKGKIFNADNDEIVLGKISAEKLNKTVNDTLELNGEDYKITGIFETGDPNQDEGAYAPLASVQELMDDEGNVSMIYVKVDSGANVDQVTKTIEDKYGNNITTVTSISDIETIADALDMVNSASFAISLLAIIIGGIGIINTMIMSVYERTREIGVLKAVGWKGRRILGMILGESIVLTVTSGIVGSVIGVIGVEVLVALGVLGGMTPVFTITTFAQAFGVAILVGLVGGLYPAWRASRLPPTEALRYE
ncbi:ABC transporter permease [Methanobrevibacter sp. TMH8]|uniref:ABC transporter permease n=1 Tax=Methanobrevibacter sp. TMH8 TaxID=2848611 RepID=UPI001CCDFEE4|nr:ABC transporter permease [Methanobrevibacter sp. TMH8]MBZ9571319.1 ABC transporter permease [Methanobrevibacter sp. TMH8]